MPILKKMKSARNYMIHARISKIDYRSINKICKEQKLSRSKAIARIISKGLQSESLHPNLF